MGSTRWALTYRPKKFKEILGQAHIKAFFKVILNNWYEKEISLPVGALFGGHSGVGKTTTARVIAASLNCAHRKGEEPCGECSSCLSIVKGEGGIMEIDSALFGSVGAIRDMREQLMCHSFVKYQVVILDECHTMSKKAFSVLLKFLEEPPERLFFILVTTEMQAIMDTVRSRLLEFKFTAVRWAETQKFLNFLLLKEEVHCSEELLFRLYKITNNNLRELIVLLEQLSVLGEGEITEDLVKVVCGDTFVFKHVFDALRQGNYDEAISLYEEYSLFQPDFKIFIEGFVVYIGDALRRSLISNSPDCDLYAVTLKGIYTFQGNAIKFRGMASCRLLFFRLIETFRDFGGGLTKDKQIEGSHIFNILTKPKE